MKSLALLAAAGCMLACAVSHGQTIQVNKDNRTIAVTASDTISAEADTATVHIGFLLYGPDYQTAYGAGSRASNAIVKALTDAGVAKDTIQSESQGIGEVPQYELNNLPLAERAQRQFKVQQSWTVKTAAADAAKLLNVAVNAGANQSGTIDWTVKDTDALEAEAARKALERARAVARQMAAGLGAKLGTLIYASNQLASPPGLPWNNRAVMAVMGGSAPLPAPLAINPRKVEKSATVYAVFALE